MYRLEEVVSENRFVISVVFPVMGALAFVGSAEGLLPEVLRFNPLVILLGTLVMRLPLVSGLEPLVDRKAVGGLGALTVYTYAIEFVGLRTGFPYGSFEYVVSLGPVLGGLPVALPVFFIPLVLNAYLVSLLLGLRRRARLVATVALVVAIDGVLDPAAVSLGVWKYSEGVFYGVPLSNYAGWLLSGSVAALLIETSLDTDGVRRRLSETDFMLDDFVSFQILWGSVNVYYSNWIPVALVGINLVILHRVGFDFAFLRETSLRDYCL
ncbi:bisanhydrobacterioruberin hydratase [Halorutilales archaeon Cl-col2-1]